MEAKQFTLKAKTPKNQAILNRTIKALVKYNNLNNQRDKADDSGDEKLYRKLNRQCEVAFDNYLELADGLPKYERERLENSDVYLHYAKGGMMDNGNTKNGKYLDSLSSDKKSRILKNIASHYGLSVADAEDEVRDDDAEMLYEYIANDKSLRMEVYNDMERGKMAKGGNLQSVWNEYEENEDNNYHSENVVLLAKHFGTAEDLKEAKKILALHNKEGHLSSKNSEKRDGLDKKLYPIAIAKMKAEGIKFAKGGKTKGGFKFKKIYEVGIDNDDEGTQTLADFTSEKDAKNFLYEYQLKHPKAKLFIDSATTDFMNENKQFAKGGKTKVVENNDNFQNKEKEIERVRLQFSKNQPKNEFQKSIQTRIEQTLLKLAMDGVFAGMKDNNLDLVIKSLFYDFRIIGEDGVYYGTHKMEKYAIEVQKERNTSFGKGGSILSSNYSIGGL